MDVSYKKLWHILVDKDIKKIWKLWQVLAIIQ